VTATVIAGRGIVTPQGVVLDLETAGIGHRGAGRLLDLLVVGVLVAVVSGLASLLPATSANIVALIAGITIIFGYPIVAETFWRGRTVGKVAFGLRVVTLEAGPAGFREALIRSLFQLAEFATLGVAALITASVTDRSQRLGDLAAGTFVIRDPRTVAHVVAVPFTPPMGVEEMVASLDVSRLRPEQERVIRSFLLRVGSLSMAARVDIGRKLAEATAQRLDHDTANIGDPELYLASVMAALQLREGGLAELAMNQPTSKRRFRR